MWGRHETHVIFGVDLGSWFSLISRDGYRKQGDAEVTFHLSDSGLATTQSEADLEILNREVDTHVSYPYPLQQ